MSVRPLQYECIANYGGPVTKVWGIARFVVVYELRLWAALFRSNTTQGDQSGSAVYFRSAGGRHREVSHEPHRQRRAIPSLGGGEACCRAQTSPAET